MRLLTLALALAAAVASPGCGDDGSGSIPREGTIVEYSRSGGVAGTAYEVTIDADGSGVARFGSAIGDLKEEEFTLTEGQVGELRSILKKNPISALPDPGAVVCADCFEYRYAYGGDEYLTSDGSESVSALDDLNIFLSELPMPGTGRNGG